MKQPLIIAHSAYYLWNLATEAAQRAKDAKRASSQTITADTITALLLAAMSTEAFINEIGSSLSQFSILLKDESANKWIAIGSLLEQLEEERVQVKTKYLLVSSLLPGEPLSRGHQPYQDFSTLIDIRNDFAHPKVRQNPPKYFQNFLQKGWLFNKEADEPKLAGWMFQMQTPEIAIWACISAREIIWNILTRFKAADHQGIRGWCEIFTLTWGKAFTNERVK